MPALNSFTRMLRLIAQKREKRIGLNIAPDFTLTEVNSDQAISLHELLDYRSKVIIICVPGLWAPWSRKLVKQVRARLPEMLNHDCVPVIISNQTINQLARTVDIADLTVLADPTGSVTKRLAARTDKYINTSPLALPVAFIINKMQELEMSMVGNHPHDYHLVNRLNRYL